jgi:DNA repair protein RadC
MTRAIIEAGRHLGLAVHDHVIIGASGHVSMRAQGLI